MRKQRSGRPAAPIDWAFRAPSPAEQREADLFLADLLGKPVPERALRPVVRALGGGGLLPARALGGEGWPEAPDVSPPPLPGLCAKDVVVTDKMALLVTKNAPLPVNCYEAMRVVKNAGALDDYKSVAAIVPGPSEARLLVFFHGDFSYVTIAPVGDVGTDIDPSRHSRLPRWLDGQRRPFAAKIKATPIEFKLEVLAEAQRKIPWTPAFKGLVIKDPVVLVPEDAELNPNTKLPGKRPEDPPIDVRSRFNIPPRCQYGVEGDGTPAGPGTKRLEELVKECYDHLRCLQKQPGVSYLDTRTVLPGTWLDNKLSRVYLAGHSGGAKPLMEAAGADMVLVSPTSAAGKAGRAVDLWLLDGTYGWGIENFVNFCTNWKNAGKLGYGPDSTRFVCIYKAGSDTVGEADALRKKLADSVLKVDPAKLLRVHDSADMDHATMVNDVIPALRSEPVIFVRTQVKHMDIPTLFLPLLLLTAAS